MVENRLVGMKSCGVYEIPGGTLLFTATCELESLTLDREAMQVKDSLALKYAELVYAGQWFSPWMHSWRRSPRPQQELWLSSCIRGLSPPSAGKAPIACIGRTFYHLRADRYMIRQMLPISYGYMGFRQESDQCSRRVFKIFKACVFVKFQIAV